MKRIINKIGIAGTALVLSVLALAPAQAESCYYTTRSTTYESPFVVDRVVTNPIVVERDSLMMDRVMTQPVVIRERTHPVVIKERSWPRSHLLHLRVFPLLRLNVL